MDLLPPRRPRQRIIPRERKDNPRRVHALRRPRRIQHDNEDAPDCEHAVLAEHVEVQLAGGDREVRREDRGHGRGREGDSDVEEPAEQGRGAHGGHDCDGGDAGCSCRLFRQVGSGVVCGGVGE